MLVASLVFQSACAEVIQLGSAVVSIFTKYGE